MNAPGAEGLVAGVHVQFDVDSDRHTFASATETSPLATIFEGGGVAGSGAVGLGAAGSGAAGCGASATGGFSVGVRSSRGTAGSSTGAGVSTRADAGAAGAGGSRNPNHHAAATSMSTRAMAIGVADRPDGGVTGDETRSAAVGRDD